MRYLTRFVVAIVVLSGCRDNSPVQQNQPTGVPPLELTGERTLPDDQSARLGL